ncbi:GspH/FimT family pseudopilin [Amphritea sp. 1_MG-2023]|uniref:GspH/FimT family pseudopilin n=1 Tax=Amphritea sp. 1_MG-2023 TaxID=3062670 RepID=UPI0026E37156|nr:GspH/FimT family pseudopilin [Amphritea sp. 1_MG-2023]MDO6563632.1 GspH/FimT family pseudopilin [Amphritea sp. 1_MG-2023]
MYKNRQHGFTLIELMVSVAVAAILIAIGVPSFSEFIKRGQITEQRDMLYSSLMFARSEAVNRGHSVSVCVSSNQATCSTVGTGTVSWASGWLVFTDEDADGALDSGDTVLQAVQSIEGGNTLEWDDGGVIIYNNEGGSANAGTFTLCDASKTLSYARAIIISSSGRIRRDTLNASGGVLTCN